MSGAGNIMSGRIWAAFLAIAVLVAGCGSSQKEPDLLNLKRQKTPDEFSILPNKPLVEPADYAALPAPTPGGINRADPTPEADAVAALGGNLARAPGGDRALIAATTRFGVSPGIRGELAAADRTFREENQGRFIERLFNVNVYFQAYKPFELDQERELERFRRAGIPTSSPPPAPAAE